MLPLDARKRLLIMNEKQILFIRLKAEVIATDARLAKAIYETNWGKSERLEGRKDGLLIAIDLLREASTTTSSPNAGTKTL